MEGKWLGMNWKIVEEKRDFAFETVYGILIMHKRCVFRQSFKVSFPLLEPLSSESIRLIWWMCEKFRLYSNTGRFKRILLKLFGKKYENSISLWKQIYIK